MTKTYSDALKHMALILLMVTPCLHGQTTAVETDDFEDEDIFELSPFEVTTTGDDSTYFATDTLAGSRVRTDLKDIASSISVVTSAFLKDTGARNVQDLLVYTTNTEVGGIYGNYGGVGNTYINGMQESFLQPNQNTRVRGLDSADNTREFFLTDIPWDSYNVSRVDLQRGPNSILFGLGSPAGIINSSLNSAEFGSDFGSFENRLSSFNSVRHSLDYNKIIIDDELAVRVALLDDHNKFRQKPAYNRDRRGYLAVRWQPKLIKNGQTVVRANYETGDVDANRPRMLPPEDRVSPYFYSGEGNINRGSWDPYFAWLNGITAYGEASEDGHNNWIGQYMGNASMTNGPAFVYNNPGAVTAGSIYQATPAGEHGIDRFGNPDGQIDGFPYGSNLGILGYGEYARELGLPGAASGFFKDVSMTDDSIFNFYEYLIDGPNKKEWQNWESWNLSVAQTFLNDKIGIEFVADQQLYDDGYYSILGGGIPVISVDIRANLMNYPWTHPDVVSNPDVGRAYIAGNTNGRGGERFSQRANFRFTTYAEIRADDFVEQSKLTEILGRHVFTGLYSKDTFDQESRIFAPYALDNSYTEAVGFGLGGDGTGTALSGGVRTLDMISYLSGSLQDRSSASGLNLSNVKSILSPTGFVTMDIFDSTWNAPSVDPSADWYDPANDAESTQSENIDNYVGWTPQSFDVLNAFEGDLADLYQSVNRIREITESVGLTWQGYWLDDHIVTTFGWRRDKQQLRSGTSNDNDSLSGVASVNPALDPLDSDTGESVGESVSWGTVLHAPDFITEMLPWNSNLSLSFSSGKNNRVENRYTFSGAALPNAEGETEDISLAWTLLNNRLRIKATWYETKVLNANISSVTGETATLGSNTYMLYLLEAWGAAAALTDLAGVNGEAPAAIGHWGYAYYDEGYDDVYADTSSDLFRNHPSTITEIAAIDSFLSQLQPQEFYDAYGLDFNAALGAQGDYQNAFGPNWTPGTIGGVQAAGRGRINGVFPIGTVDNTSKGIELEVAGQITDSWNVAINVSKTEASQTALGSELMEFIEAQHQKFESPAGDIRLWWAGDASTLRDYFRRDIWGAYQFQLETNGRMVAELAPWRANIISNYTFNDGVFKGANVGFAYRWEDKHILGYALNEAQDNLDINSPYWSDTMDHFDLWAGYERQLNDRILWRVQINLRNVGEDVGLVPLSVQPDGSPAQYRIQEGMTWSITNTFSF